MAGEGGGCQQALAVDCKVLVLVEQVLPDLLVVSFSCQGRDFRGVLLDASKRRIPCGANLPSPPPTPPSPLSQRHTYIPPGASSSVENGPSRAIRVGRARSRVRLRPRRILCWKCRTTCASEAEAAPSKESWRREEERERSGGGATQKEVASRKLCPSLIPSSVSASRAGNKAMGSSRSNARMVLRKNKRGVGSMEDLWDESAFEDASGSGGAAGDDAANKRARMTSPSLPPPPASKSRRRMSTPLIKISFGARGQGTVLRIPPRCSSTREDEKPQDRIWRKHQHVSAEAAKRALRKAQLKLLSSAPPPPPPADVISSSSASSSSSETSALSLDVSTTSTTVVATKHHKKHKKRRRHSSEKRPEPVPEEPPQPERHKEEDSDSAMKERCLRQKLSITLKRINASVFLQRSDVCETTPLSCDSSESSRSSSSADFVPPNDGSSSSSSSLVGAPTSASGSELSVGDVVWGKIHGFPWWPGKVLSIWAQPEREAHVAWFASSTSSRMPCDRLAPFLPEFKARYNRKKRGPYKEAIRQATLEARQVAPVGVELALALQEVGLAPSSPSAGSPSGIGSTAPALRCPS